MPVDNPEWQIPFTFTDTGVLELEQGSLEEIQQCVYVLCCFNVGDRIDEPTYGIPDQVFQVDGVDLGQLQQAIDDWETRASEILERDPAFLQTLVDTITIRRDTSA